jgi:EAL domain-containing protein (putative c-di-GMP-specific phosphodiesterase class I)
VAQSEECREIVRTILNLARALGLAVVAEGTETSEQAGWLARLNCSFGQGYFFGRPMPFGELQPARAPRVAISASLQSLGTPA